jgi:hypothetical protein
MKPLIATFALTRGYQGGSKIRYFFIIQRNIALRKFFGNDAVTHILFHEGNISGLDQFIIRTLSMMKIHFIDVSKEFIVQESQIAPSGSRRDVGYRLMCRFQYFDVWKFLDGFDYAYRVDEDCIVISLPRAGEPSIFLTGALSEETHTETNESLYLHFAKQNLEHFYDHKFPYTNCYLTKVSFWLQPHVQEFLRSTAFHERALVDRWGDLPVLGVTLKVFAEWNAEQSVDIDFVYRHQSHNALVSKGTIIEEEPKKLIMIVRHISSFFRWIARKERP